MDREQRRLGGGGCSPENCNKGCCCGASRGGENVGFVSHGQCEAAHWEPLVIDHHPPGEEEGGRRRAEREREIEREALGSRRGREMGDTPRDALRLSKTLNILPSSTTTCVAARGS